MGMSMAAAGSGKKKSRPQAIGEMNTTPLIDVMLVLLVMLIITIPIQLHSVDLNLPSGKAPPATSEPEIVRIDVDFDGTVYWNGEAMPDRARLEAHMREKAAQPVQPEIHLRPNKLVHYEHVAAVMASAQRLGLKKLGMVGNEQFVK
ncbi:Biopolymer transport protein ExbD/TolR [Leptothrix cholodnii SP-6]|uniref:Biopolymer transport protein ExbD/TolR n=1 Tax=Leptothrix cholodnii (strain ATCC 51168 / LMG 8142 / SP-6) TaxID=395495 RepID=B1Y1M8_LEPCP|nr:biopolymer transporter ExbD [Leptothrix cholodnii]ACB35490.1 Biopolymer transport protein ExbD/TolR [Leptothrix cholodnii SP-6]